MYLWGLNIFAWLFLLVLSGLIAWGLAGFYINKKDD